MNKKIRFLGAFIFPLSFLFFAPGVFAADTITPSIMDVPLNAGKSFSLDLLYSSGEGGTYDLTVKKFEFAPDGQKKYLNDPGFMTLSESVLEFKPDESKIFVLSGRAPDDLPDGDYYYSVHVTRRQDDPTLFYTTNLASLIFVKVGPIDRYAAEVRNLKIQRTEEGKIETLAFDFTDTAARYFLVYPQVVFLAADGSEAGRVRGEALKAFPAVARKGTLVYFADKDFLVPEGTKADFQLLNERDEVLYRQALEDFHPGDIFLSKEKMKPRSGPELLLRLEHNFVWTDWVLRFVMIAVGLSLIGYFFYYKR